MLFMGSYFFTGPPWEEDSLNQINVGSALRCEAKHSGRPYGYPSREEMSMPVAPLDHVSERDERDSLLEKSV